MGAINGILMGVYAVVQGPLFMIWIEIIYWQYFMFSLDIQYHKQGV